MWKQIIKPDKENAMKIDISFPNFRNCFLNRQ